MAMKTRYNVVNGQVLSETRNGVRRDYLTDGLGNTLALLDSTQTKTDTFDYFPSGTVAARTGTTATPFQWIGGQGYFTDSSTRKYVRARNYHNNLARWNEQDPIGFKGGDFNLYRYCGNRFVIATDPSGLLCRFIGFKPDRKPAGKNCCTKTLNGKGKVNSVDFSGCYVDWKYTAQFFCPSPRQPNFDPAAEVTGKSRWNVYQYITAKDYCRGTGRDTTEPACTPCKSNHTSGYDSDWNGDICNVAFSDNPAMPYCAKKDKGCGTDCKYSTTGYVPGGPGIENGYPVTLVQTDLPGDASSRIRVPQWIEVHMNFSFKTYTTLMSSPCDPHAGNPPNPDPPITLPIPSQALWSIDLTISADLSDVKNLPDPAGIQCDVL